ncbi:putative aspartate aminotransferase, cytoplasmic 2 isoform X1 [Ictalurus punctatus]|uniref:aspartate transaminase n=1 Tax=Ictalurus punctatus TaxID=7998 RepID=A0A2D0R210_ICTPU|nr:putative aspartate aminotransferase, cytoplasmic 2 isoform X1 [Ictalurus punctatus]
MASCPSAPRDTPVAAINTEEKLLEDFQRDSHPDKVCLACREYVGEDGHPIVNPLIRKIKQQIATDPTLIPEYPPPLGIPEFSSRASQLALGRDSPAILENRVLVVQTVGSSGAVRLGAELLKRYFCVSSSWAGDVLLSSPCDESLPGIFKAAGIEAVKRYRYWDSGGRKVCVEEMLEDLEKAPEQSTVVLSASGHSPTGADLSQDEWKRVAEILVKRRLLPFFLLPAQGLCSRDIDQDSWALRYCVSLGMELLCAQSFSHNFSLYGERVAHLLCVVKENATLLAVQFQAEKIVQTLWSRPPVEGARVVTTVLSNPAHMVEWQEGLKRTVERCMLIKERLREKLRLLGSPGTWEHLIKSAGLYCCIGLSVQQVEFLVKQRHVYLLPGGCFNVSAINSNNLDYVAESLHLILTT